MKRTIALFVFTIILTFMLTSCDVHFGDTHYDVHWWVIAIPVVIILVDSPHLLYREALQMSYVRN